MNVLSIQSWVAYGHVGNVAAMLPLQRLGHEVWAVQTVQFSNHPGHGGWKGRVFDAAHVGEIVTGLAERGLLATCDAVLSGYLGEAATGAAVLDAVKQVKAANPRAIFCCDPVMGDDPGGLFVRPGIPEFFARDGMAAADILTPNRFELQTLAGTPVASLADATAAARSLIARGPKLVAVTGLAAPILPDGRVGTLLVAPFQAWLVATPRLALDPMPNGTGDVFAALFLGHLLHDEPPDRALALAVSSVFALVDAAGRMKSRELPLVVMQDQLARPNRLFEIEVL